MSVFRPDIRQRLWIALGMLAFSTLFVGAIAWYSLDRADSRLEELHRSTLLEVARALRLSKQSSDLATSVPFLLGFRSQFLIEREGRLLTEMLDHIAQDWPSTDDKDLTPVYSFEREITAAVADMKFAITDLVGSAELLNQNREATQEKIGQLRGHETFLYERATVTSLPDVERNNWLLLQTIAGELSSAARAENLLGVGERRRNFQRLARLFQPGETSALQQGVLEDLTRLTAGKQGLFEIRRRELTHRLDAQNALFRIRVKASLINGLSGEFAANAEAFLSQERSATATSIDFAKIVILVLGLVSVVIALFSALYVSEYVTGNIRAISEAMGRLAQGDRSPQLARKPGNNDEIGKLLQSFRVFRANALRLDRSNRQLTQKNALFEQMFSNISDGVAITGEDGRLTAVNPNFNAVLNLAREEQALGQTVKDVLGASAFGDDQNIETMGAASGGFSEIKSRNDTVLEVRHSPLPDGGGVWLFSDATERRRIEARVKQIQYIEGLEKVSGEVAHDFGNILSSITTNIHLFEMAATRGDSGRFLERVKNAVEIGSSLVQRLLAFAKKQALQPEVVDLNILVSGLADLISIGLKDGVELKTTLAQTPLWVRVDPGQLESAILNLCLNSNQAIEGRGVISISVENSGPQRASILVSDTGNGMEHSTLTRAFEPFFSARSDGDGTGLGLPMVYGFMKQSGGDIDISSQPGKGTEIQLSFPIVSKELSAAVIKMPSATVLLVEDDASDMAHARNCLQELGYNVVEARSFKQARTALLASEKFEFILTDLHLDGGKSGWALARICKDTHPDMRILVVSGRLPQLNPFSTVPGSQVRCIEKPLSSDKIRYAIDKKDVSSDMSVVG